ncbi:hypothetical protein [Bacillus cereus group sp. BfR-BA-01383]|uniref:hypothetical protein n=1 Tax=Bacillus cereus group sp. BfR-BA-01383 TaxID=2920327 RepID=UPI001F5AF462|nr:hypothetical protein [Bacillus cereus group sp. BfR-BA-01383]
MAVPHKGDAILRLLMEMKLELKEVKEQVHTSLKNMEKQNKKREIPSTVSKKKQDWKYPSKMK